MILLVCVDDALGMAFNHRRQSMDRALRDRLRTVCAGKNLFLSPYSMKQFEKDQADTDLTMEAPDSAATASSGTASTALPVVRFHADRLLICHRQEPETSALWKPTMFSHWNHRRRP